MKTNYMGDTSREHTALRSALKAGARPQYGHGIAPPIPILRNSNAPLTAGAGEGSLPVDRPEVEAEWVFVDWDDIANHDFPIPPSSQHRVEGRVTEETGKLEEERVHPGGEPGRRPGDRQRLGYTPTIMDQNKSFPSQEGDVEPRNDNP